MRLNVIMSCMQLERQYTISLFLSSPGLVKSSNGLTPAVTLTESSRALLLRVVSRFYALQMGWLEPGRGLQHAQDVAIASNMILSAKADSILAAGEHFLARMPVFQVSVMPCTKINFLHVQAL